MKKVQSFLLALIMLLSIAPASVMAEDSGLVLPDNYEITDTAYSSTLGYVVAAKDYTKSTNGTTLPVILYNSQDGITWTRVYTNASAYNNANKYSRQQLVWWEDAGVFVLGIGGGAVYSANGTSWSSTLTTNQSVRNNAIYEVEGSSMISSGGRAAVISSPDNFKTKVYHHCYDASSATYTKAVGLSPAASDGSRSVLEVIDGYCVLHSSNYDTSSNTGDFLNINKVAYSPFATLPYDAKYINSIGGWALVNGTDKIHTVTTGGVMANYTVVDATNVTAIGTDGDIILVGKSDGSLYWAPASSGIAADTAWTQVSGTGMDEEVRSITETSSGKFIAATKTKVFEIKNKNGSVSYDVFKEEVPPVFKIGKPSVSGSANAFEGTWLLGGAYSDALGMYVAYGNTIEPAEGDNGRVYTSTDGVNWTLAYKTEYSFSSVTTNGAAWWDKAVLDENDSYKGAFVISCATSKVAKTALYSCDGINWNATDAYELCSDGDIIVNNDNLYTLDDARNIKKVGALKPDGTAEVTLIPYVSSKNFTNADVYGRKLAISDNGQTFMINSGNYVMQWTIGDTEAYDMNVNVSQTLMDAAYDTERADFVGVHAIEAAVYGLLGTTRTMTWRPFGDGTSTTAAATSRLVSLIKAGDKYVFGRADGKVYLATTPLSKESVMTEAVSEANENAIRVRDVVAGAQGKALAIAGGTAAGASDALLIDTASATYKRANDNVAVTANPGDEITISIPYVNTIGDTLTVNMITAIYSGGKLVQVDMRSDYTIDYSENGVITQTINVSDKAPENCSVKVMLWDDSLIPYTNDIVPVFR